MNLRDCTHTRQLVSVRVIQSRALSIAASCATCSASSASAMPSTGRNTPLPTFRAEPCVHAPAQFDVLQPVQDEQRALDAGVGEMTKSAPTVSLFRGSHPAVGQRASSSSRGRCPSRRHVRPVVPPATSPGIRVRTRRLKRLLALTASIRRPRRSSRLGLDSRSGLKNGSNRENH